jgi:hypothetical protein
MLICSLKFTFADIPVAMHSSKIISTHPKAGRFSNKGEIHGSKSSRNDYIQNARNSPIG